MHTAVNVRVLIRIIMYDGINYLLWFLCCCAIVQVNETFIVYAAFKDREILKDRIYWIGCDIFHERFHRTSSFFFTRSSKCSFNSGMRTVSRTSERNAWVRNFLALSILIPRERR